MANNQNTFKGAAGISLAQNFKEEVRDLGENVRTYIDLRVDAVSAQTDAKIERVLRGIWVSAISVGAGVVLGLTAIMALGGDRFDGGMSASGAYAEQLIDQKAHDLEQDDKLSRILDLLEEKEYDQPQGGARAEQTGPVHQGTQRRPEG